MSLCESELVRVLKFDPAGGHEGPQALHVLTRVAGQHLYLRMRAPRMEQAQMDQAGRPKSHEMKATMERSACPAWTYGQLPGPAARGLPALSVPRVREPSAKTVSTK